MAWKNSASVNSQAVPPDSRKMFHTPPRHPPRSRPRNTRKSRTRTRTNSIRLVKPTVDFIHMLCVSCRALRRIVAPTTATVPNYANRNRRHRWPKDTRPLPGHPWRAESHLRPQPHQRFHRRWPGAQPVRGRHGQGPGIAEEATGATSAICRRDRLLRIFARKSHRQSRSARLSGSAGRAPSRSGIHP